MTINSNLDGGNLTISVNGRLDTSTSPVFQKELDSVTGGSLSNIKSFVLDLEKLDYISSAGLRVVLMIHKDMISHSGDFVIRNVSDDVRSVFEVTGFCQILNIE